MSITQSSYVRASDQEQDPSTHEEAGYGRSLEGVDRLIDAIRLMAAPEVAPDVDMGNPAEEDVTTDPTTALARLAILKQQLK